MLRKSPCILVIDDELGIRRFLKTAILTEGYEFIEAKNGKEGLEFIKNNQPDVVLLDLGLPDIDGMIVLKHLRNWSTVPVIILSARDEEQDKVDALNFGADDYLTKPFGVSELKARIRVALRHSQQNKKENNHLFISGTLKADFINREIWISNQKIQLTPIQYDIFAALIRKADQLVTHKELLREIWGDKHTDDVEYLRIYIYQLRHKLEKNPAHPQFIITEPGIGYRLCLHETYKSKPAIVSVPPE